MYRRRTARCVGLGLMLVATAGAAERQGALCIAGWKAPTGPVLEVPPMSFTPAPSETSVYGFAVDGRERIEHRSGEPAVLVEDLPVERRVKVVVTLNGKPAESFRVDLSEWREGRACLALEPNYWHWTLISLGTKSAGCHCKAPDSPSAG